MALSEDARTKCAVNTAMHTQDRRSTKALGNPIGGTTAFYHRNRSPLHEALLAIQLSVLSPRSLLGSIGNCGAYRDPFRTASPEVS